MTSLKHDWWRHKWIMTSWTVWISTKMIPQVHSKPGKIVLQHRYYWYQRTFLNHKYGVWLETGCMKRFFVTAVVRATSGPESEDDDPHSRRILNFDIYASQPLAKRVLTCRHPLKLSKVNIHQSSPYHDQGQLKYLLTYLTFKWSNENGTQKLPLFSLFFFF